MIAWRKSSRSGNAGGANCVEVGAWRKSSRSGGGSSANCVEVGRRLDAGIAVRDTKHRTGTVFTFTPDTWSGFMRDVKSGTFDVA